MDEVGGEVAQSSVQARVREKFQFDFRIAGRVEGEGRVVSGVTTRTSWPRRASSRAVACRVLTTPLICGVHASETMRIFKGGFQGYRIQLVVCIGKIAE